MQKQNTQLLVLLVEDDEDDYILVRNQLAQALPFGYHLEWAPDYGACIDALCRNCYDVCLLDYQLGEHSGLALLREIGESRPTLPVIVLTGHGGYEVDLQAMRAGAVDYIAKEQMSAPLLERSIRYALERKRVERELIDYREQLKRLVEERTTTLQAILDTIPVGVVLVKAEGREISYASPVAMDMLGEPAEGSTEGPFSEPFECVKPGGAPFPSGGIPIYRSLDGERVTDAEMLIRRRDGSEASILVNSAPLRDASGSITGAVASLTDITRRKAAEEAVRRTAALLQKVLESLPVGIWITDGEGCIVDGNPAGQHIWGGFRRVCMESYDEFKGCWLDSGKPIQPREWAVARAILNGETSLNEEIEIETFDGSRKIILNSAIPIRNEQGEISGAIIVNQDITAQKRAERQIHFLTRQLIKGQDSERQKLSHDLHEVIGQDLSALKIGVDTILDDLPEPAPELRQKVAELSRMLQESITALRDLSYTLRPATLDQLGLVRAIEQYCEEFSKRSGVQVDFFAAGMEDLKLDYQTCITLYRLLHESLSNVGKYAGASTVKVRIVASFPKIILFIRDDGMGFDVRNLLSSASREQCTGLRIMEERTALVQGKMTIESSPRQGTMIRFEVPQEH